MPQHTFLLYALLLCNVLLRTLTNEFNVLPRILNVIDIPIVGTLFILSLVNNGPSTALPWARTITRRSLAFCLVLIVGASLNPDYFYLPAALSQVVMLLEPLVLFLAIMSLPFTEDHVKAFSRLLNSLIVFEIVLGIVQLPQRIQTGNSELVHGTFPGNAEQYGAFLMVGIFYLLGRAAICEDKKRRLASILLILVLNVSIDNKASWLGTVVALSVMLWKLNLVKLVHLRIPGLLALIAGLGCFVVFVASKTSDTVAKYDKLWDALIAGNVARLGKVKAYLDIIRSNTLHPHTIVVGAGVSNMYSRASRQYYLGPMTRERMYRNPAGLEIESDASDADHTRGSNSMAGVLQRTAAEPYYLKFYGKGDDIIAVGSRQVDGPFSPYAGLLGETGFLGAWLYMSIYIVVLRQLWASLECSRHEPNAFCLGTAACGFMIYVLVNSVYGPFLETTRYTTILWSMVGLYCVYVQLAESRRVGKVFQEKTEVGVNVEATPEVGVA